MVSIHMRSTIASQGLFLSFLLFASNQTNAFLFSHKIKRSVVGVILQAENETWMTEGILISSFTDGLAQNQQAQDILRKGLFTAIQRHEIRNVEKQLADSVRSSPCNGPDMQLLERLEFLDSSDVGLKQLRMVYIPTAMYAQRLDSSSTPGKQRQRAKADARKRRNDIVSLLTSTFDVHVVTVDLGESGSVTHPELWTENQQRRTMQDDAPNSAREALTTWQPHFIYIQGGNTFWLHDCMMEKYGDALRNALAKAFFCGASAGAIVAGRHVSTALWKGWDDPRVVPKDVHWEDAKGLNLLGPYSCFPHYDETWDDTVAANTVKVVEKDPNHKLRTIADHEVVYVDGTKQELQLL